MRLASARSVNGRTQKVRMAERCREEASPVHRPRLASQPRSGEAKDEPGDAEVGEKPGDPREPRSTGDAPPLERVRLDPLTGVRHVDEHEARDLLGMARGEELRHEAAVGVAHENVGGLESERFQAAAKLGDETIDAPRFGRRIAPAETGAVVAHDPSELCDFRLDFATSSETFPRARNRAPPQESLRRFRGNAFEIRRRRRAPRAEETDGALDGRGRAGPENPRPGRAASASHGLTARLSTPPGRDSGRASRGSRAGEPRDRES